MWADRPLLGVGPDNFEAHYEQYAQRVGTDQRAQERAAHNLYLESLAETRDRRHRAVPGHRVAALAGAWRARRELTGDGAVVAEGDTRRAHRLPDVQPHAAQRVCAVPVDLPRSRAGRRWPSESATERGSRMTGPEPTPAATTAVHAVERAKLGRPGRRRRRRRGAAGGRCLVRGPRPAHAHDDRHGRVSRRAARREVLGWAAAWERSRRCWRSAAPASRRSTSLRSASRSRNVAPSCMTSPTRSSSSSPRASGSRSPTSASTSPSARRSCITSTRSKPRRSCTACSVRRSRGVRRATRHQSGRRVRARPCALPAQEPAWC